MDKNCAQYPDHQTGNWVGENFVRSEGLASRLTTEKPKSTAEEVQGADKHVQKANEECDLCHVATNSRYFAPRVQI